jgi:phosphatidate phosphatase APP1
MCLKVTVAAFIIALSLASVSTQPVAHRITAQGVIHGVVEDFLGPRVPHVPVVFKNEEGEWQAISDDNGEFQITLPAGRYVVTVNHSFFYPFEMKKFIVEAGKAKTLKVSLKYDTKKHPPVTE